MTGTRSCDRGGADALLRVYQRASASGAQVRIAVTSPVVRRVLEAYGLDRLVSICPSGEAAIAARTPGVIALLPRPGPGREEGQARSRGWQRAGASCCFCRGRAAPSSRLAAASSQARAVAGTVPRHGC